MTNVVGLLNVKQLIMVDYKVEMRLKDLVDMEYFKDNLFCVFENTRLDFMFRKFREGFKNILHALSLYAKLFLYKYVGNRGHMAFVDRVNDEGPGDPFYERIVCKYMLLIL